MGNVEEKNRPYALTQIKSLKVDDAYIVDVIVYTTNSPNRFDEATGSLTSKLNKAFTDLLGNRYWMASIVDGVRQYVINTPKDFKISEFVERKIYKYRIKPIHDNQRGMK